MSKKILGKISSSRLVASIEIRYDFRKYWKTQSLGSSILNGRTTLKIAANDPLYLKEKTDNFKKSTRPRDPEKIYEKEIARKNANEPLTWRQSVINAFKRAIFWMIAVNANDDDDYDYDHLIYDDELYPKGTLTPKTPGTPGTPLVIMDSPP